MTGDLSPSTIVAPGANAGPTRMSLQTNKPLPVYGGIPCSSWNLKNNGGVGESVYICGNVNNVITWILRRQSVPSSDGDAGCVWYARPAVTKLLGDSAISVVVPVKRHEDRELHPTFISVIDPDVQTETNRDRECLLDLAFSDRVTPPGFRATNIVLGMQMAWN